MMPSLMSSNFSILGLNSQILCKYCKKLENICRIRIFWYISIKFCTLTNHSITKVKTFGAERAECVHNLLFWGKTVEFRENLVRNWKKFVVSKFVGLFVEAEVSQMVHFG